MNYDDPTGLVSAGQFYGTGKGNMPYPKQVSSDQSDRVDPSPGTLVVDDVGGFSFLSHYGEGTGDTVEIVGKDFLDAVRSSPQVQAIIKLRVYDEIRRQAQPMYSTLKDGETAHISFDDLHERFTFPGSHWPTSRYWAFGNAYFDIHVDVMVKKQCDSDGRNPGVIVTGTANYSVYDVYQWEDYKQMMGGDFWGSVLLSPVYAATAVRGNRWAVIGTLILPGGAPLFFRHPATPKDFRSEWSWFDKVNLFVPADSVPNEEIASH